MMRFAGHALLIAALTLLTQLGGIAWLLALFLRHRLIAFLVAYTALAAAALLIAPQFGRVGVTCWRDGPLQVQSFLYCALNRTYMTPDTLSVLERAAEHVDRRMPGTVTLLLDAGFPFGDGFPLLPHLSHSTGKQADLALYYSVDGIYQPRMTRSPIGYFAFEDGEDDYCTPRKITLRWNLDWLQPLFPDYRLDLPRTAALLEGLKAPSVKRIFVEPHLVAKLGIESDLIRFQGCRAARHDDHIHVELR